jgi:hypothetical protein
MGRVPVFWEAMGLTAAEGEAREREHANRLAQSMEYELWFKDGGPVKPRRQVVVQWAGGRHADGTPFTDPPVAHRRLSADEQVMFQRARVRAALERIA